jgi:hypothetical protein
MPFCFEFGDEHGPETPHMNTPTLICLPPNTKKTEALKDLLSSTIATCIQKPIPQMFCHQKVKHEGRVHSNLNWAYYPKQFSVALTYKKMTNCRESSHECQDRTHYIVLCQTIP